MCVSVRIFVNVRRNACASFVMDPASERVIRLLRNLQILNKAAEQRKLEQVGIDRSIRSVLLFCDVNSALILVKRAR